MKNKGFTLLELMVAVVIVAILAAFAIPNYQQYVLRSHRVEARNALQTIAQRIDQNFSVTRQWNRLSTQVGGSQVLTNATLISWGLNNAPVGGTVRYTISFVGAPNANGYILRAQAVGAQARDRRCANFFLTQSSVKMATQNGNNQPPVNGRDDISRECWTR